MARKASSRVGLFLSGERDRSGAPTYRQRPRLFHPGQVYQAGTVPAAAGGLRHRAPGLEDSCHVLFDQVPAGTRPRPTGNDRPALRQRVGGGGPCVDRIDDTTTPGRVHARGGGTGERRDGVELVAILGGGPALALGARSRREGIGGFAGLAVAVLRGGPHEPARGADTVVLLVPLRPRSGGPHPDDDVVCAGGPVRIAA